MRSKLVRFGCLWVLFGLGCQHQPPGPGIISQIEISHGGCYGTCPVYTATIMPDGSVHYHGKAFTTLLGKHDGRVPAWQFAELAKRIHDAKLETYRDRYASSVTDLATVVTRFTIDGRPKEIQKRIRGHSYFPILAPCSVCRESG